MSGQCPANAGLSRSRSSDGPSFAMIRAWPDQEDAELMDFGLGSYGFGFLAGVLSTLSPCVLPIVPILLGSASNAHRHAPLALAGGLALSYAVLGTALAWVGASMGIDTSIFRNAGAVILGLLGVVLMSSAGAAGIVQVAVEVLNPQAVSVADGAGLGVDTWLAERQAVWATFGQGHGLLLLGIALRRHLLADLLGCPRRPR